MTRIEIEALPGPPAARRRVEVVERKGLGHPDTLCDRMAEAAGLALARHYVELSGRVLHFNTDKALLVAGSSIPALGGGLVTAPMRLVLGDRATDEWDGHRIPVADIAAEAVGDWVRGHLRYVDPSRHLAFESALRPGSAELTGIYQSALPGANDTSTGVGVAPLTETEELVIAAERHLNSPAFHARHPECGEDVKVMAVRLERRLELTVAVAFVDRFVESEAGYFEAREEVRGELERSLRGRLRTLEELDVRVNTLDAPGRGTAGMYLTVLGTSADGADGGEVGRGNRPRGVIAFHRPCSLEAAAGKNPAGHVGKIYNALAQQVAERVQAEVPGLEEVRATLVSRIGAPLKEPWIASLELVPTAGAALAELEAPARAVLERELAGVEDLVAELVAGRRPVC